MADDIKAQFSEDDDVTRAKAWWQANGSALTIGIIFGLAIVVGYNYLQSHQESQAEQASELYTQLENPATTTTMAEQSMQQLFDKFADSPYTVNAALLLARHSVANNDLKTAAEYLRRALQHSADTALSHIARIRLATVLLAQDKASSVLDLLANTGNVTQSISARYLELKGDALAATGDNAAARTAYQQSLDMGVSGGSHTLLKLKLDNLAHSTTN